MQSIKLLRNYYISGLIAFKLKGAESIPSSHRGCIAGYSVYYIHAASICLLMTRMQYSALGVSK